MCWLIMTEKKNDDSLVEIPRLVTLFFLRDYNWKRSDIISIGYNQNFPAETLMRFLKYKINKQFGKGYSIIAMENMGLEEFKKKFPNHRKEGEDY